MSVIPQHSPPFTAMDSRTYNMIASGDIDQLSLIDLNDHSLQMTHQNNTILHVAVLFGRKEFIEEIGNRCPRLLTQQNLKGDTPLHIAARLKKALHSSVLIDCARQINEENNIELGISGGGVLFDGSSLLQQMIRMENNEKDTALHEAVRYHRLEVVKLLIQADQSFQYFPNKLGETPLYMAAEKGLYEVVKILKEGQFAAHRGPNGRTALQAAIVRGDSDIAKLLLENQQDPIIRAVDEKRCSALHYAAYFGEIKVVSKLLKADPSLATMQDNNGKTALHIAASSRLSSIVANESERYDKNELRSIARTSRINRLRSNAPKLKICDRSYTFGMLYKGRFEMLYKRLLEMRGVPKSSYVDLLPSVKVVEKVTQSCPECWEMLDNNGQNILHVAAENGQLDVIEYIVMKSDMVENLINEKDNKGNTPLHLVLKSGCEECLNVLSRYDGVNKKAINNDNLTAFDIVLRDLGEADGSYKKFLWSAYDILCEGRIWINGGRLIEGTERYKSMFSSEERRLEAIKILLKTDSDDGIEEREEMGKPSKTHLLVAALPSIPNSDKEENNEMDKLSDASLVVAALVATVSFAAGFTLPGGYDSNEPHKGMPFLIRDPAFVCFMVFNNLAMVFSTSALLVNFTANIVSDKRYIAKQKLQSTHTLITHSITAMFLAFVTGTFAVLRPSPGLAITLCVLNCTLFYPYLYLVGIVRSIGNKRRKRSRS